MVETAARSTTTPTGLGMLFWPEFGAAVVTAGVFGALFRTRFVPLVALAGMVFLAGAARPGQSSATSSSRPRRFRTRL